MCASTTNSNLKIGVICAPNTNWKPSIGIMFIPTANANLKTEAAHASSVNGNL
jgi:hypothetical protein